jgi:hypothetical protein
LRNHSGMYSAFALLLDVAGSGTEDTNVFLPAR